MAFPSRNADGDYFLGWLLELNLVQYKVNIDIDNAPAMFLALSAASCLDENASHGFSGYGKEMTSAIPLLAVSAADQTQVRFVDQGRA